MGDAQPNTATLLLADNRLSEGARILGFWIMNQEGDEDGWVELRFDAIRGLLYGFPSDDVIRKHLRMLRGSGWAERRPGGQGRGDRYRIIAPSESVPNQIDSGQERVYSPDRLGSEAGLTPPDESARTDAHVEQLGSSEEAVVVPPDVPPLDSRASTALDQFDQQLSGCRSALRDYLVDRVEPPDQSGYVQTIATWLNGFGFTWRSPDGSTVKADRRPGLLAAALNELRGHKDGEQKMKWPQGDVRNLKTKLEILLKQEHDYERNNGRGGDHGRGARQKGREAAGGGGSPEEEYGHLG